MAKITKQEVIFNGAQETKGMARDEAGDVLRPMRARCWKAGHCLGLTVETDCNLFPVRRGWCRGRV